MAKPPKKRTIKTADEFRKIIGDAKAFRHATFFVEQEIRNLRVTDHSLAPLHGDKGWTSHDVWASYKTVSHFNLQNAFELGFKAYLGSLGISFFSTHFLKGLYAEVEQHDKAAAKALEDLFNAVFAGQSIQFKAFVRQPSPPKAPKNLQLKTLKDFLDYFDRGVGLWKKRYAWEAISQWSHYIDNLEGLLAFLDRLEELSLRNWNATHQP